MKTYKILFATLFLLFFMMVGCASAKTYPYFVDDQKNVWFSQNLNNQLIFLSVSSVPVNAPDDSAGMSFDDNSSSGNIENTKSKNNNLMNKQSGDNSQGENSQDGDSQGGNSQGQEQGIHKIPEFSSVAVPVVTILGMLFILQRRKEN